MMFFQWQKSQSSLGALIKTLNASVECEYLSPGSSGHAALDCCSADYGQSNHHLSTHPECDTICHNRGAGFSACLKPSPGGSRFKTFPKSCFFSLRACGFLLFTLIHLVSAASKWPRQSSLNSEFPILRT